jgi:type I restriction enzyme S subunit
MLSARNIENNRIVFDEYRLIAEEDFKKEHARTRLSPGDVLLTMVGSIGRSAVVPEHHNSFALQRSVAVMTPTGVLPKYLMYSFSLRIFSDILSRMREVLHRRESTSRH